MAMVVAVVVEVRVVVVVVVVDATMCEDQTKETIRNSLVVHEVQEQLDEQVVAPQGG